MTTRRLRAGDVHKYSIGDRQEASPAPASGMTRRVTSGVGTHGRAPRRNRLHYKVFARVALFLRPGFRKGASLRTLALLTTLRNDGRGCGLVRQLAAVHHHLGTERQRRGFGPSGRRGRPRGIGPAGRASLIRRLAHTVIEPRVPPRRCPARGRAPSPPCSSARRCRPAGSRRSPP
jgi:hypothetical protein